MIPYFLSVYMNYPQFLVYGLLKIFLKEIVNHGVEKPLLCSYFLKRTAFWMMQEGSIEWYPKNLLNCFWMCFKYLIQCVYRSVLPNFFIPQNKMFTNKVLGAARTALLKQLYLYYKMDVFCLRSIFEPAFSCNTSVIPPAEGHHRCVVDLDNKT
jgi:hypothetical protein